MFEQFELNFSVTVSVIGLTILLALFLSSGLELSMPVNLEKVEDQITAFP